MAGLAGRVVVVATGLVATEDFAAVLDVVALALVVDVDSPDVAAVVDDDDDDSASDVVEDSTPAARVVGSSDPQPAARLAMTTAPASAAARRGNDVRTIKAFSAVAPDP